MTTIITNKFYITAQSLVNYLPFVASWRSSGGTLSQRCHHSIVSSNNVQC